ncbi:MAG TPA: family 20 glycosylhydrolase, partial [Treponema sp.]|nr:family 20 glycosylhydrolase [Treponema sp.]
AETGATHNGPAADTRFLGIQANVWTEYIRDGRRLEYMLFPRLLALAETAWNGRNRAPYTDFVRRLERGHTGQPTADQAGKGQRAILVQRDINFCHLYEQE